MSSRYNFRYNKKQIDGEKKNKIKKIYGDFRNRTGYLAVNSHALYH